MTQLQFYFILNINTFDNLGNGCFLICKDNPFKWYVSKFFICVCVVCVFVIHILPKKIV